MDNGSTDGTPEIARKHGVKVHIHPDVSISELRNLGAKLAHGEVLLFLDSDMLVDPNWLNKVDDYFFTNSSAKNQADVVGFLDRVPNDAPWYAKVWSSRTTARRQTLRKIDSLPGRNIAVSRKWFDRVSGFNPSLKTSEDRDFVLRLSKAGACVFTDPSLKMIHLGYEQSFIQWCRKEYWRQHSHVDLLKQNGLSIRLLRFPLLAVAHWVGIFFSILAIIFGKIGLALSFLALTWIPSLGITLRYPYSRQNLLRIISLSTLYWLRFYIAGYAVITDLYKNFLESIKKE